METTGNIELIKNIEKRDSAIILENYDKIVSKTYIHFQCKCGNKDRKQFYNIKCNDGEMKCKKCMKKRKTLRYESTCFVKYGTINAFQNEDIKQKIKNTCKTIYGVDFSSQSQIKKNKTVITCIKKYGCENPMQNEIVKNKAIKTSIQKYGTTNPSQSYVIVEKIKQHMLKKYGCENPMQSPCIVDKQKLHSYKSYPYITPSGSIIRIQGYEKFALDELYYLFDSSEIKTNSSDIPEIWYTFNNKKHRYFCDIYINILNLIIEVKSEYTYNCDILKNNAKRQACIDNGFDFEFWIYDKYGNKTTI